MTTHPTDPASAMREACAKVARTAADDPLFDHEEGFVRRIGSWIALRIEALPVSNPTAPVAAMREACEKIAHDHINDAENARGRKPNLLKFISEEAREEIFAEERGEKIAAEMIAKKIRALPLPAAQPDPCDCSVCGKTTDMLCSNCRLNFKAKVYVCGNQECRREHERMCFGDGWPSARRSDDEIRAEIARLTRLIDETRRDGGTHFVNLTWREAMQWVLNEQDGAMSKGEVGQEHLDFDELVAAAKRKVDPRDETLRLAREAMVGALLYKRDWPQALREALAAIDALKE